MVLIMSNFYRSNGERKWKMWLVRITPIIVKQKIVLFSCNDENLLAEETVKTLNFLQNDLIGTNSVPTNS